MFLILKLLFANAFAISSAYLIKKPTANVRPAKGPNLPNNLNNTPLLPKNPKKCV